MRIDFRRLPRSGTRVEGRVAIVTGASSGIGRALSLALAAKGAVVVMAARRLALLEAVGREIGRWPQAAPPACLACDVTDPEQVARLVRATAARFGRIDAVINNAGAGVYGEAERTTTEDYREVLEVNLLAPMRVVREVLPWMRRQGSGLIVNIASLAALHGVPYLSAYGASKAALASASQSLRAELAGDGIRVMVVYPGYTGTGLFRRERRVGGARRPSGPYVPPARVAEEIVRGIETGVSELVLTTRGKALDLLRGLAPALVDRAMRRTARELQAATDPPVTLRAAAASADGGYPSGNIHRVPFPPARQER